MSLFSQSPLSPSQVHTRWGQQESPVNGFLGHSLPSQDRMRIPRPTHALRFLPVVPPWLLLCGRESTEQVTLAQPPAQSGCLCGSRWLCRRLMSSLWPARMKDPCCCLQLWLSGSRPLRRPCSHPLCEVLPLPQSFRQEKDSFQLITETILLSSFSVLKIQPTFLSLILSSQTPRLLVPTYSFLGKP